ncbi:MAG: NAD(P)/FAD-dependent oxidoreductase [Minisyncoccales bacterium]
MNNYELVIVGGGPAGITAGIYAARQRVKTLLITKGFGGQIARKAVQIENYPGFEEISGLELIQKLENHLRKQVIEIKTGEVKKVEKVGDEFIITTKEKENFKSKAVIVCSGADPRPLEIAGEKEFLGRGVSYCTVCDAPLFANKTVAIIGGGNAGFEAAVALAQWARKIYILEYGDKIIADAENQERAQKTGKVELILNAKSQTIKGEQMVKSLVYLDRKTQQEKELPVDGIFIEIGTQPATAFVKGLAEFNEKDEIKVDPFTGETNTPGLFAAGDADNVPYKQIVVAAGEGAKAALSAVNYLRQHAIKK